MKQPSNFSLDLTIGALFLIGLSFLLSYVGTRAIFPNDDITKPFMIMGIVMSIGAMGMLYHILQLVSPKSNTKINLEKEKVNLTIDLEDKASWIENQARLQEPSPAYLALVITFFSIIGIVIWVIISQL